MDIITLAAAKQYARDLALGGATPIPGPPGPPGPPGVGFDDAPADGTQNVRRNEAWEQVSAQNLILNPVPPGEYKLSELELGTPLPGATVRIPLTIFQDVFSITSPQGGFEGSLSFGTYIFIADYDGWQYIEASDPSGEHHFAILNTDYEYGQLINESDINVVPDFVWVEDGFIVIRIPGGATNQSLFRGFVCYHQGDLVPVYPDIRFTITPDNQQTLADYMTGISNAVANNFQPRVLNPNTAMRWVGGITAQGRPMWHDATADLRPRTIHMQIPANSTNRIIRITATGPTLPAIGNSNHLHGQFMLSCARTNMHPSMATGILSFGTSQVGNSAVVLSSLVGEAADWEYASITTFAPQPRSFVMLVRPNAFGNNHAQISFSWNNPVMNFTIDHISDDGQLFDNATPAELADVPSALMTEAQTGLGGGGLGGVPSAIVFDDIIPTALASQFQNRPQFDLDINMQVGYPAGHIQVAGVQAWMDQFKDLYFRAKVNVKSRSLLTPAAAAAVGLTERGTFSVALIELDTNIPGLDFDNLNIGLFDSGDLTQALKLVINRKDGWALLPQVDYDLSVMGSGAFLNMALIVKGSWEDPRIRTSARFANPTESVAITPNILAADIRRP